MNTFLNLVYRIVKGSPLTPSEHDENLDKISENAETVNSRLGVALKADGTLKDDSVGTDAVQAEAITPAKVPDNSIPLVKLFYEEDEGTPVRMFPATEEGRKRFADKFVNLRMIADEVKGLLSDELFLVHFELTGTSGVSNSGGTWEQQPLNLIKTNEIGSSATLVGNQVTLPAGKWRIRLFSGGFRKNGEGNFNVRMRLRRMSPGGEQTLFRSTNSTVYSPGGTSQDFSAPPVMMYGQIELAEETLVELQAWAGSIGGSQSWFYEDMSSGPQEPNVWTIAEFRRLGGEPSS